MTNLTPTISHPSNHDHYYLHEDFLISTSSDTFLTLEDTDDIAKGT